MRISSACTACGACLATCPTAALSPGRGRPDVRDAACTDCLACIEVCPAGAITEVVAGAGAGAADELCTFFSTLEPIVQITDDRFQSSRNGTEFATRTRRSAL